MMLELVRVLPIDHRVSPTFGRRTLTIVGIAPTIDSTRQIPNSIRLGAPDNHVSRAGYAASL
jgi:hypothetical protein